MPVPTVHRDARDKAAEERRKGTASVPPLFTLPKEYNARYLKPCHF